ncbi:16S rRNA (adenine(1518)-N(6)/adenine(1519)-N(6))-dimethyltransferase [Candidatus Pantoea edessiphila]|uniref:Ribosomal RNA small subunit methyltransferase A n=1 Tax=Candidatus Pantoea edessiphila TaxID=2044610 RepID=A0A2P5SY78_9GAMM|nr:16S rRNA (adenine(1518)-N(6)/adenine(1519)-N(6))-dimethyltransferase RsmA [Candidatus Pantoea edessiphila]MBK4775604.1 16S rRNA (adenine(1518)-N(6)/adenine(1519)-N(6))-dimethyltransferase RsmA [Pantoea sp. Edef]PPI87253.1 16S rRNA (adenine(1518)-N(6)/adenine(1519)-N(6))-dimethyltransferase [Candidatus Pantoea edessiphila]
MNKFIYQDHIVRKRFGQNFLNDDFVIKKIISTINPQEGQLLIEIGPGLGALTQHICKYTNKLIVIELDSNLAEKLKVNPIFGSKLSVFQKDVMKFDFKNLSFKNNQLLRIFGNLPYHISTILIFNLFKNIGLIKDMHFTLQKEVVDRMVVGPGSKIYSRLSVMTQYHCKVIPILEIYPKSFIPIPKVNSIFVRLIPYDKLPYPVIDVNLLNYITTIAFSQRRKKLKNSLSTVIPLNTLKKLSVDPELRAENITVSQYCSLANWLSKSLKQTQEQKYN